MRTYRYGIGRWIVSIDTKCLLKRSLKRIPTSIALSG